MAVDLERIGRATLKELGDIRIDDVLSFIDRGIARTGSSRRTSTARRRCGRTGSFSTARSA
jgi:hypothetical protein